jgi:hypothetical protein
MIETTSSILICEGIRVSTPLGFGLVIGTEEFYGGKLIRYLVKLDDPSQWSFGNKKDVAAFFEYELRIEKNV